MINNSEMIARLKRARFMLPDAVTEALNATRPLPAKLTLQATAQAYADATTDKARAAVLADAAAQSVAVAGGVVTAVQEIYDAETLDVVRAHADEIWKAAEAAAAPHVEALSVMAARVPADTDPSDRGRTPTPVLVAAEKAAGSVSGLNGIVSMLSSLYGFSEEFRYPAAYLHIPDEISAADAVRLYVALRHGTSNKFNASGYKPVHWFAVAAEIGCTFALLPPADARRNDARIGSLQTGGIEASAEWDA